MNINYRKGNQQSSFSNYKFPANLPTEEWDGNEVRSYSNYIRPVANLFENDRENYFMTKDLAQEIFLKANSVISGCKIAKSIVNGHTYYEVKTGAFIYSNKIYYIFPNCEMLAAQIEANSTNTDVKIWFDGTQYRYSALPSIIENTVSITCDILSGLGIVDNLQNYIGMPILNIDSGTYYICFNGGDSIIASATAVGTVLAKVENGTISYPTVAPRIDGSKLYPEISTPAGTAAINVIKNYTINSSNYATLNTIIQAIKELTARVENLE